jgi:hypothetical protein
MYLTANTFTKQTPKYYEERKYKYGFLYPHNDLNIIIVTIDGLLIRHISICIGNLLVYSVT